MSENRDVNISCLSDQTPLLFQRELEPDILIRDVHMNVPGAMERLIAYYDSHIHIAVLSFLRLEERVPAVAEAVKSRIRTEFHAESSQDFQIFLASIIRKESYDAMTEYAFGSKSPGILS